MIFSLNIGSLSLTADRYENSRQHTEKCTYTILPVKTGACIFQIKPFESSSVGVKYMSSKKGFAIILLTCITVLLFFFIKNRSTDTPDDKKQEKPPVAVETFTVESGTFSDSVDVVGTLSPKIQTNVMAEYGGIVRKIHVREWVQVKKGDILLTLDTREPRAMLDKAEAAVGMEKANLLQADVAVQRAEREYNRLLLLKESGLATSQNIDEAETERNAVKARKVSVKARLDAAEQDLAQAKLRFEKNNIYSPIDGVVAERKINEGDLASNSPLFTIVDNRVLDLTVTVPSRFIRFLKPGLELQFTTDAFPDRVFSGRLKYINPVVSDRDRSVKVIAEVANEQEELKGGLFINGKIMTDNRDKVILVPRNSLINWDMETNRADVLVAENNIAQKRQVTVGTTHEDRVELISGISTGELIILRGGYNIREGDRIKTSKEN